MRSTHSHLTSMESDDKVTRTQFSQKFADLRADAKERATQHRSRLNKIASAPAFQQPTFQSEAASLPPKTPELKAPDEIRQKPALTAEPTRAKRHSHHQKTFHNTDHIALWSVVAPSTIAAIFAGLAMSSNNVPLSYAIGFIAVWFALTTTLAICALTIINTKKCTALLRASTPRLGVAAISCALVAVLTVEVARLSITKLALPNNQQVGESQTAAPAPAVASLISKTLETPAGSDKSRRTTQSTHFPTTPAVIAKVAELSAPELPLRPATDLALPQPTPPTVAESSEEPSAKRPRAKQRPKDQLLGQISAKGKFLAHRGSSRWPGSVRRKTAKRQPNPPRNANILEKIFSPVINSANAKAPARRIGAGFEDLGASSR